MAVAMFSEDDENAYLPVVRDALRSIRSPLITQETDLHAIIARQLDGHGVSYVREFSLGPRERVDFLACGAFAIEVKKGKPNGPRLKGQISRYARFDLVLYVFVVTPWSRHLRLPDTVHETPVEVIGLNKLWGVGL